MNRNKIEQILLQNNLEKAESIEKIKIGFTNDVYSINDKYILKVCKDINNEGNFEREVFFYDLFRDKIPVPRIISYDNSKKLYNKFFTIYHKIQGDNLYSKWHLISNSERKSIIKQLCGILEEISKAPYEKFVKQFQLNPSVDWQDKILSKIKNSLNKVGNKELISSEFIQEINNFVEANQNALTEQKIALVYWDAHFDNIIVKDSKIVGILDFERTELASIDYNLDIIKRMVDYPKKYMSEEFEKYAKKEDYSQLLIWFQEFYPELFEFKNLDKRLDLYSIEHDLDTLLEWPSSNEVKQMIAKVVHFSSPTF